jgi:hypothetical protein
MRLRTSLMNTCGAQEDGCAGRAERLAAALLLMSLTSASRMLLRLSFQSIEQPQRLAVSGAGEVVIENSVGYRVCL